MDIDEKLRLKDRVENRTLKKRQADPTKGIVEYMKPNASFTKPNGDVIIIRLYFHDKDNTPIPRVKIAWTNSGDGGTMLHDHALPFDFVAGLTKKQQARKILRAAGVL